MTKWIANGVGWVACAAVLGTGCAKAKIGPRLEELLDSGMADGGVECSEDERIGQPCQEGKGSCQQTGEYLCADGAVACSAEPLSETGRQEICGSGRDEDCDGAVDEAPDGRCCGDEDCGSAVCVFPLAAGATTGTSSELTAQGGTCLQVEDAACSDESPCASSDQVCVSGRCEARPVMRSQVGLMQSSGAGVMRGSGYVLQLRVGSSVPVGTMRGSGKVAQIGLLQLR